MSRRAWLLLLTLLASRVADAGLLAEATRVIYTAGQRERSLMLANTNPYPVVVQTWIDQGAGDPESAQAPFVVLPAVFRLQPSGIQGLRILHNGDALPEDRESVFWLNLYEIPPTASDQQDTQDRLELAMNTQLKLFYRPAGLKPEPAEVADRLSFSVRQENGEWFLVCRNPTPYHASFTALALEAAEGDPLAVEAEMDMMTAPFTERRYRLAPGQPPSGARVRFGLVNDGGFVIEREAPLRS